VSGRPASDCRRVKGQTDTDHSLRAPPCRPLAAATGWRLDATAAQNNSTAAAADELRVVLRHARRAVHKKERSESPTRDGRRRATAKCF